MPLPQVNTRIRLQQVPLSELFNCELGQSWLNAQLLDLK